MNEVMKRAIAAALMVCLSTPTMPAETLREGTCNNASERFPDNNPGPGSLKAVRPLEPTNLNTYVRNRQVAIALGKAMFWDMQFGSDGIQSCASCHFRAGADPRSINQANPGGADNPNTTIHVGVNKQLTAADFPLHKVADPTNRMSALIRSVDDVISSQGVKLARFLGVIPGFPADITASVPDPVFNLRGMNTRRAEPRNTPTVINTAYNNRLFWDGRAQNIFNGVDETGVRNPDAKVVRANGLSQLEAVKIRIENAALASQAVAPLLSDREMAALDRPFLAIGKRLASAKPLRKQRVASTDSALAPFVNYDDDERYDDDDHRGLNTTYREMIEAAFQPAWWRSNQIVVVAANGSISFAATPNRPLRANEYTLLEYNFSLFFGLAVQLYEMTLISDDAPMDRYFDGNPNALSAKEKRGLAVFTGEAACAACHAGAETTNNSTRILNGAIVNGVDQPVEIVERMFNGNCEVVTYDQSFYNIGVRPTEEDFGSGNKDKWGNPLAWVDIITNPRAVTNLELRALALSQGNIANPPIFVGERTSTKGAFKVPSLRNIGLTAPYFHNGGQATLRQAIEFYNRGGDFRERNSQFIDFEIGKLNLTEEEIDDLVAFLDGGLTDRRVVRASAPFDHPELFVPNGHRVINGNPVQALDGTVQDVLIRIKATGRNGGAPLPCFLER
jgi:cytochrome c peroxidase